MSDRELVLEAVQKMPEDLTIRQIIDELLLTETIRERLSENPQGNGVSAEELLGQISSWATK